MFPRVASAGIIAKAAFLDLLEIDESVLCMHSTGYIIDRVRSVPGQYTQSMVESISVLHVLFPEISRAGRT